LAPTTSSPTTAVPTTPAPLPAFYSVWDDQPENGFGVSSVPANSTVYSVVSTPVHSGSASIKFDGLNGANITFSNPGFINVTTMKSLNFYAKSGGYTKLYIGVLPPCPSTKGATLQFTEFQTTTTQNSFVLFGFHWSIWFPNCTHIDSFYFTGEDSQTYFDDIKLLTT